MNDMPTDMTATQVGLNIRAEMGRRRISMVELHRRTGIARSTLAHQIDVSRVTVDTLVAIAKALDVDVNVLLPADDTEASA